MKKVIYFFLGVFFVASCDNTSANDSETIETTKEHSTAKPKELKDCSSALRYAKSALSEAERANRQSDLDDMQSYARRANSDISSANSYAGFCDCTDAKYKGSSADSDLYRASNESSMSNAQSKIRSAISEIENMIRELNDCNEEEK